MFNPIPADHPFRIISNLNSLARKTGFVIRNSAKFSPAAFLYALLQSVCNGQASFNQLVIKLNKNGCVPMSRQALHQRLGNEAVAFLLGVIGELLNHSNAALEGGCATRTTRFKRVLVEDSSILRLPKAIRPLPRSRQRQR